MRDLWYNVGTIGALIGCLILGVVWWRRSEPPAPAPIPAGPSVVEDWEQLIGRGHLRGPAAAPVRIVEFSDFQCPYCAAVQADLARVVAEHDQRVAIEYRHLPIVQAHPSAFLAAIAAECAGDQGRFWTFHDTLFASQAEIGTRSWESFGIASGVRDIPRFLECVASEEHRERVSDDVATASRLGIGGTPAFIVNGRLLPLGVEAATLEQVVRKALEDET